MVELWEGEVVVEGKLEGLKVYDWGSFPTALESGTLSLVSLARFGHIGDLPDPGHLFEQGPCVLILSSECNGKTLSQIVQMPLTTDDPAFGMVGKQSAVMNEKQ